MTTISTHPVAVLPGRILYLDYNYNTIQTRYLRTCTLARDILLQFGSAQFSFRRTHPCDQHCHGSRMKVCPVGLRGESAQVRPPAGSEYRTSPSAKPALVLARTARRSYWYENHTRYWSSSVLVGSRTGPKLEPRTLSVLVREFISTGPRPS
jgi:hypothetical protein